jgi:hypothetical protein
MTPATYTIEPGYGYQDVSKGYVVFCRAAEPIAVTVTRDFRAEGYKLTETQGYTHSGKTADGRTVNFKIRTEAIL